MTDTDAAVDNHVVIDTRGKACSTCKVVKPVTEYHGHPHTSDGLQSVCKQCHAATAANGYRKMSATEKDRRNARSKAARYGMTLEEMLAYVDAHNGLCDICGKPDTTHRKATWTNKLTFDHDHASGKLRGMLCSRCNIAIGSVNDDPAILRKLADYIERFR
jgi:hypothetical protein